MAGCAWIAVHGRTTKQRAEPCNVDAIRTVRASSTREREREDEEREEREIVFFFR